MLNCVQICKNTELHIHGKVANSSLKQCDCEIFFVIIIFLNYVHKSSNYFYGLLKTLLVFFGGRGDVFHHILQNM